MDSASIGGVSPRNGRRRRPGARHVLLVDLGIAVIAAIVVLTLTPGLAVAAMLAVVVLIGCVVSVRLEARRHRAARTVRRGGTSVARAGARSRPR